MRLGWEEGRRKEKRKTTLTETEEVKERESKEREKQTGRRGGRKREAERQRLPEMYIGEVKEALCFWEPYFNQ